MQGFEGEADHYNCWLRDSNDSMIYIVACAIEKMGRPSSCCTSHEVWSREHWPGVLGGEELVDRSSRKNL
jgi:hypothetical protein